MRLVFPIRIVLVLNSHPMDGPGFLRRSFDGTMRRIDSEKLKNRHLRGGPSDSAPISMEHFAQQSSPDKTFVSEEFGVRVPNPIIRPARSEDLPPYLFYPEL